MPEAPAQLLSNPTHDMIRYDTLTHVRSEEEEEEREREVRKKPNTRATMFIICDYRNRTSSHMFCFRNGRTGPLDDERRQAERFPKGTLEPGFTRFTVSHGPPFEFISGK